MINNIRLLRSVGQFENTAAANLAFRPLTLIYAENGRGKTTLTAILRSLASGNPNAIVERERLAATRPLEIVIDCTGGPPPAMFRNGAWNRSMANLTVFDDLFVDTNVYSGLSVGADHRQNLHDVIIGSQGVALNERLQSLVERIEVHNADLRARASAVPGSVLNGTQIDDFCALVQRATIDAEILEAERALEAARQREPIRQAHGFDLLSLPEFDVTAIQELLAQSLDDLDAAAAARVHQHLEGLPRNSEQWINDGLTKIITDPSGHQACPFCSQDLAGSPVLTHYRAYFGAEYRNLKQRVEQFTTAFRHVHSEQMLLTFERALQTIGQRQTFWARFADVPAIEIDSTIFSQSWQRARDLTFAALAAKQASPLEKQSLTGGTQQAIRDYAALREQILAQNIALADANRDIALVKERAEGGNAAARQVDVNRLRSIKARFEPAVANLCAAYLAEKAAKTATEQERNEAREALTQYRRTVFPTYGAAINQYLSRFNAGFRLGQVEAVNTRGGPSCNYTLQINNVSVTVGADPGAGQPSFRNTLSAGDRNTLALALFFASLDADPNLADKVIVIDDPVSSLDDNRTRSTVHEIYRLVARVRQLVILSHSKLFLCQTWDGRGQTPTAALLVRREGPASSVLDAWNVDADLITSHDRRHATLRGYVDNGYAGNLRDIAVEIRPTLEYFCRVAYPAEFLPGELLGTFRTRCMNLEHAGTPVIAAAILRELQEITDYGNQFHHDTNPNGYLHVVATDVELRGFIQRTMAFCRK